MKFRPFYLFALLLGFLSSCAKLDHQTAATAPHASVRVAHKSELARSSVTSIDGLAVKPATTYRLRPGKHSVEIEYKTTVTMHGNNFGYNLSPPVDLHLDADGGGSISGGDPFGTSLNQPVNFSADDRRFHRKSLPFQVEAGKRYLVSPDLVTPCQQLRN
jgi:hypothetical protein